MEIVTAIQLGILISLIMIYFSTRSLVDVLNHHFTKLDEKQDDIIKLLETDN